MPSLQERLQVALGEAYRVERELGGGGMSRVFVAEELELGRKVVVKVLPSELAVGVNVERFRREIQLAASLQHPHIVPLLRAGHADDLVWYTMPLVEGESLRLRLVREGELPIQEAVSILRDVTSALAYAHAHGLVHRDIKPDNILLTGRFAVVTDFGVAKAVGGGAGHGQMTSVGVALGTPAYMAPEQASADPHTDHRADIYAVGVIAYEMLAGHPLFTGSSPQSLLAAHVTETPIAVTRRRATVPPALAATVMRCLEKKPADRWQTAAELLRELDAVATPTTGAPPVAARAAGWRGQLRHRGWLAAGALILLALAVTIATVAFRDRGQAAVPERPMLAVLPFQNLGGPDEEYFADGMTEEITSRLASVSGLGIISRTSAMQYKNTGKSLRQIAEELDVDFIVEGTIRWERRPDGSSRVRVTPQLIRVADDTHLWAQAYDADLTEVFRVQSDIAGHVARALDVTLLAGGPSLPAVTSNPEAYQHYLRGNEAQRRSDTETDIRAAIESYEQAVTLDPEFAAAYARLSRSHARLYWFYYDRTQARIDQALRAAQRALELRGDLADAHLAMGYVHYWGNADYDRALRAFEAARTAAPNDADVIAATGFILRRQGKWREAAQRLEEAMLLDPRSSSRMSDVGVTYHFLREFERAEHWYVRALALNPEDALTIGRLAQVRAIRTGRLADAIRLIDEAVRRDGSSLLEAMRLPRWLLVESDAAYERALLALPRPEDGFQRGFYHAQHGVLTLVRGDTSSGLAHLDSARALGEGFIRERPLDAQWHVWLAGIYAELGRGEEAVRLARRAVELTPVEKDALAGTLILAEFARIQTRVGDNEAAIALLERLLDSPSPISVPLLRVEPTWEPLRSDRRFQRLLERD